MAYVSRRVLRDGIRSSSGRQHFVTGCSPLIPLSWTCCCSAGVSTLGALVKKAGSSFVGAEPESALAAMQCNVIRRSHVCKSSSVVDYSFGCSAHDCYTIVGEKNCRYSPNSHVGVWSWRGNLPGCSEAQLAELVSSADLLFSNRTLS